MPSIVVASRAAVPAWFWAIFVMFAIVMIVFSVLVVRGAIRRQEKARQRWEEERRQA